MPFDEATTASPFKKSANECLFSGALDRTDVSGEID
jgi:hypothetical protein